MSSATRCAPLVKRAASLGFVCALVVACDHQATQPVVHTQLVFTVQPNTVIAGATLTPPIQVEAEDASGMRVTTFAGNVTIARGPNLSSGTLSGTTTVAALDGVATFRNLRIDAAGDGFTLVASAPGVDAGTSAALNVVRLAPCVTNNCWTVGEPLPTVRTRFSVGTVNGMIYVLGGQLPGTSPHSAVFTVEAYDPNTNRWLTKAPSPTWPGAQIGVVNGVLYAVGGTNTGLVDPLPTGDVEAYDPVTDTWTPRQSIANPPYGAGVGVVNGILYAVGGIAPGGSGIVITGTLQAYDPASDTWTTKAPMPTPRIGFRVGVLNGLLYVVGGDNAGTVEAYDPVTDTWVTKQHMLTVRSGFDVGVVNGMLYAVGGATGSDVALTITDRVEAYDPATNTWTTKAPMPIARLYPSVAVLNGILYALGGNPPFGYISGENDAYHP
jgi:N-acetylneuraminic acid mutarotase